METNDGQTRDNNAKALPWVGWGRVKEAESPKAMIAPVHRFYPATAELMLTLYDTIA